MASSIALSYPIMRGTSVFQTVKALQGSTLNRQLMATEVATLVFSKPNYIKFLPGDFVTVRGVKYTLGSQPTETKNASNNYGYSLDFESPTYEMLRTQFMNYDDSNNLTQSVFNIVGTPFTYLTLIQKNLNRFESGWTIASTYITGDFENISFSGDTVLSAINTIAQTYNTEWYLVGKEIHLQPKSNPNAAVVSYGEGNGLTKFSRTQNSNAQMVTRLYVYGSTTNINAATYGSPTLKLPGGVAYLEENLSTFGLYEGSQTFDTIYPQYVGQVSSITTGNPNLFGDSAIDFNPNTYAIPSTPINVYFYSGNLSGYTFTATWDNTAKTWTLAPNNNDQNVTVPSTGVTMSVGDKYTITGISMPPSYITDAENLLQSTAQAYIDANSIPNYTYSGTISAKWILDTGNSFDSGDSITFVDSPMSINISMRVLGIQLDLTNQIAYTLTLGNVAVPDAATRIIQNTTAALQAAAQSARAAETAKNNLSQLDYIRTAYQSSLEGGLFTTEVIRVGLDTAANAGISGIDGDGTEIRFWAGDTFEDRSSAPFRVQEDGTVYASAIHVLNGATIGDLSVINGALVDIAANAYLSITDNENPAEATFIMQLGFKGVYYAGDSTIVGGQIRNLIEGYENNIGLILQAFGGSESNIALDVFSGDCTFPNGYTVALNGKLVAPNFTHITSSAGAAVGVYQLVWNSETNEIMVLKDS